MQLSPISRIIVASISLLIAGTVAVTPSVTCAQTAQSQTVTSGTVKSTAPVGSGRLRLVSFVEHSFVAYSSTELVAGTEVSIEILKVKDIEGRLHDVAYVMTPKK